MSDQQGAGPAHHIWCNYQSKPVGSPGCICHRFNREAADQQGAEAVAPSKEAMDLAANIWGIAFDYLAHGGVADNCRLKAGQLIEQYAQQVARKAVEEAMTGAQKKLDDRTEEGRRLGAYLLAGDDKVAGLVKENTALRIAYAQLEAERDLLRGVRAEDK